MLLQGGRLVKISVGGIDTTVYKIGMFEAGKKLQMIQLVGITSNLIAKSGRQLAPVSGEIKKVGKNGDLKRSIRSKIVGDRTGIQRTVAPRKPKGSARHLVAYGTDIRRTKAGKSVGAITTKNDFMQRAENSQKAAFEASVRGILNVTETI